MKVEQQYKHTNVPADLERSVAQTFKEKSWYKSIKHVADSAVRFVARSMPAWNQAAEELVTSAPMRFSPALPVNIASLRSELQRFFVGEVELPATRLLWLDQVCVSSDAVVFKNLRLFAPALPAPWVQAYFEDTYLLKQWFASHLQPDSSADVLAMVHDYWSASNYYHWMVDSLPRLLLLRQHQPGCILVLPEPAPAFIRQTAALLGFERWVSVGPTQVLKARRLLLPAYTAPAGYQHPELMAELRGSILRSLYPGGVLPRPTRRIYVSRNRQKTRRLSNEPAIEDLLRQHGFETVYFEGLTFEQQVAMMLETSVLMGVHGANLTNIMFLPAGGGVIELMNEDKLTKLGNKNFENLIYCRMSAAFSLPYYCIPCQTAPGQEPNNDSDVVVDSEQLALLLDSLEAGPLP